MTKTIIFIGMAGWIVSFGAFTPPAVRAEEIKIANPASLYCMQSGYMSEIRNDDSGGQYGVCIFPDGYECDEWAFFRGECGREYRKLPEMGNERK